MDSMGAQDSGRGGIRLWIDGGIMLAILGVIYYAGALTEQVENNGRNIELQTQAFASLELELHALRNQPITAEASRRIAVLESRSDAAEKAVDQLRKDVTTRLDRIEEKLDRVLSK